MTTQSSLNNYVKKIVKRGKTYLIVILLRIEMLVSVVVMSEEAPVLSTYIKSLHLIYG